MTIVYRLKTPAASLMPGGQGLMNAGAPVFATRLTPWNPCISKEVITVYPSLRKDPQPERGGHSVAIGQAMQLIFMKGF